MKAFSRLVIPGLLLSLLVLAGCTLRLPPNIPSTGGTQTPTTPAGGQGGLPAATAYPGGGATPTEPAPVVITATPSGGATTSGGATAAATAATGATAAPAATGTNAPAPTNTPNAPAAAATRTPAATAIGGQGNITLPAQIQPIQFATNTTSSVVNTTLQNGVVQAYSVNVLSGQRMFITIDGSAGMQVFDPNKSPISQVLSAINPVQISLSQSGNHYIALRGTGPVTMSVYIPAVGANQSIPAPVPQTLQPIQFPAGGTSATITTTATAGTPLGYTLTVLAGQTMTATTNGNATLTLLAPDGATLVPTANVPVHQWRFPLAQAGKYTLIVLGSGPVSLQITIPPVGTTQPTQQPAATGQPGAQATPIPLPGNPTRVTIAPGNASTTLTASLTAGTPKAYVLNIQAGQTLFVSTTGKVDVTIYDPNGTALTSGHADFPNRWSAQASQAGDYTFVIAGSGSSTLVFYIPPK